MASASDFCLHAGLSLAMTVTARTLCMFDGSACVPLAQKMEARRDVLCALWGQEGKAAWKVPCWLHN